MTTRHVSGRRALRLTWLGCLILLAACDPTTTVDTSTTTTAAASSPSTTTTSPPTTTSVPATTVADGEAPACAIGDLTFVDGGSLGQLGSGVGDATELGAMRWATDPECDRFVVDFVTANGSPASSLGSTEVTFRPGQGIVRAVLPPEIDASAVTDTIVGTALIERAFVVQLLSGNLAIDLHIDGRDGATVRALTVESPARLVIDLHAGGPLPVAPPPQSGHIVVLEPLEGIVTFPLTINGYASPSTLTVVATLPSFGEDSPVSQATSAESTTAWGEFAMTMDAAPPGVVDLFVGESADGDGVRISVESS